MRVVVWGCRGSLATPGRDTVRYGGNTSCVEVQAADGTEIILDAGTGIRPLGLRLEAEQVTTVHVLLSHLHLDHLQGLGFFQPLFREGVDVHIWGPRSPTISLRERIGVYLSPPLFPVSLSQIPSRLTFHDAPEEPWMLGSATIRALNVAHQGSTIGFRIEEGGRSMAYLPDHEPSLGVDLKTLGPEWMSGHDLAHEVDVLFHDAQYSEEEYPSHEGWGHSSIEHVVTFASMAKVKRLVLFHHDPLHGDSQLEVLLARARQLWTGPSDSLEPAYEGMEIDLLPLETTGGRG
jgi:phosphoribosyl 1,2-cyclic phosphodiesterase